MLVLALACVTASNGDGSANEANEAISVMNDSTIAAANEEIESLLSEGRPGEAVAAGLELLSRIEAHAATMTFLASHEAAETPDLVAKAMLEFTPSAKDDAELARRGIAVKERLLRRYEAHFLESLVNYGCLLDNKEANAAARLVFERVLFLADTLHLEADQRARILERLARVLESEGHVDSALATWDLVSRAEKSMRLEEAGRTSLGESNKALLLIRMQRYADALAIYERNLATAERNFGVEHVQTALALKDVAELHVRMGRLPEAHSEYERLLVLEEALHGPGSYNVLYALRAIIAICERLQDVECVTRALARLPQAPGATEPSH